MTSTYIKDFQYTRQTCQPQQSCVKKTRGVSHCGLAIYIEKYFKTKEELWKTQIFISPCKHIIFKKNPLKEMKILPDMITLITNFNTSQNIIFQKKFSYKNRHNNTLGAKIP
jgi:hypothetical protein